MPDKFLMEPPSYNAWKPPKAYRWQERVLPGVFLEKLKRIRHGARDVRAVIQSTRWNILIARPVSD
jgi:hypothetical protein